MPQLVREFDANQVQPSTGGGYLPKGNHKVIIEESKLEDMKSGNGGKLSLKLKCIEGENSGKIAYYELNLYHMTNEKTCKIAESQLSAICHATGVFKVTNSEQLHDIPFMIEIGPQKDDAERTEVKRAYAVDSQTANPPEQQQQQQQGGNWNSGQQQQQEQQQGSNWNQQQPEGKAKPKWATA
jgi:hypothetical protein